MKTQPFNSLTPEDFALIKPFFKNTKTRNINTIDTVVLHWTAGANVNNDIKTLKGLGYGYHFLIDQSGIVYQGSPLNKVVSHAGNSYGPGGRFLNGSSIGISFSMLGPDVPFNDAMYKSVSDLLLDIKKSVPTLKFVTGHHWISPGRKIDPYTFDFTRLLKTLGGDFEVWKTGFSPFPAGLSDCRCIEFFDDGNCKKSVGSCKGPGNYGYSERNLSTEVNDASFQKDTQTQ